MSGTKRISALTELASGSVDADDILPIVDMSQASVADKTKYVKARNLTGAMVIPSTGPSGDDAPNVVIGSKGAVDLPSTTYGNIIAGPRDNDVSGGVGYRNRIGSTTNLGIVLGGDNDIDALAPFNIGHHNSADAADGATHPIMIGTYLNVGEAYGIAMGTLLDNWARKAAIVGGDSNRIGTQGGGEAARNSFIGGGYQDTIDGKYAWIMGGWRCSVTKDYGAAWGKQGISRYYATMSNGNGAFGGDNATQDNMTHRGRLRRQTTDAVATQLTLDGSSETLSMPTNAVWTGHVLVSAYRTDGGGAGETASYVVTFSAESDGSAATIKSSSVTVLHEDVAGWNCDVVASGLAIQIRGTGAASSTVQWGASFTIDEMRNLT